MQITLVIPCYNEEATIAACLDAVARQTRQLDEVLVVDNNSTDRTLEIVSGYRESLPLRVLTEARQGVAWASQHGYDAAAGDVIARIDADTRVEPGWAAIIDRYLSANPDVAAVGGFCWFYDMPKWNMRKAAFARAEKFGDEASGPRSSLGGNNMAFRKAAWAEARGRVKNLPGTHEDIDLTYALQDVGCEITSLPGMLVGLSPRRYTVPMRSTLKEIAAVLRTQRAYGRTLDQVRYAASTPFIIGGLMVIGRVARRAAGSTEGRVSPVTRDAGKPHDSM